MGFKHFLFYIYGGYNLLRNSWILSSDLCLNSILNFPMYLLSPEIECGNLSQDSPHDVETRQMETLKVKVQLSYRVWMLSNHIVKGQKPYELSKGDVLNDAYWQKKIHFILSCKIIISTLLANSKMKQWHFYTNLWF